MSHIHTSRTIAVDSLVVGHQLNAERERGAELDEGRHEARHTIQREPRSEPRRSAA